MRYNKTSWINQETIITADAMNNIENGIENAVDIAKQNKNMLNDIMANAPEECDTFKEVSDAIINLNNKIDVEKVSIALENAVREGKEKIDIKPNDLIQDNLEIIKAPVKRQCDLSEYGATFIFKKFNMYKSTGLSSILKFNTTPSNVGEFWIFDGYVFVNNSESTWLHKCKLEENKDYDIIYTIIKDTSLLLVLDGEKVILNKSGYIKPFDMSLGFEFKSNSHATIGELMFYSKALSMKEINHTVSILNNKKSISEINQKKMTVYTNSIVNRKGVTQKNINKELFNKNSRRFTSTGGNITVDNAIKGYMLNGKIEGNTVKNFLKLNSLSDIDFKTLGVELMNDGYIKMDAGGSASGTILRISKDSLKVEPGKTYTMIYYVRNVTIPENMLSSIRTNNSIGSYFNEYYTIGIKGNGINKIKFTTKSDFSEVENAFSVVLRAEIQSGSIEFKICILEDDWTNKELPIGNAIDFGIHSSKATIGKNEGLDCIYDPTIEGKTSILKAIRDTEDWIEISPFEERNTEMYDYKLSSLSSDIGSVFFEKDVLDMSRNIKISNTKEIVLDGTLPIDLQGNYAGAIGFSVTINNLTGLGGCGAISSSIKSSYIAFNSEKTEAIYTYQNKLYVFLSKDKISTYSKDAINEYLKKNPIQVRYQLKTSVEEFVTNQEKECYNKNKQILELRKVPKLTWIDNGLYDSIEILDDGSAKLCKTSSLIEITGDEEWKFDRFSKSSTHAIYVTRIKDELLNVNANCLVDKYNYLSWISGYNLLKDEMYVGIPAIAKSICISMPVDLISNVDELKEYLKKTGGFKMLLQLKNPYVTHIPKDLIPSMISIGENVDFSFNQYVKPGKVDILLPTYDNIKQSYEVELLNNYTYNNDFQKPIFDLLKDEKTVQIKIEIIAPTSGGNMLICSLPSDLRPKSDKKIFVFVNGAVQYANISSDGRLILPYTSPANSNIYIAGEYRKDN